MPNPRLFIVAGPNGSGKSLFSNELTNTEFEVFDGDKHVSELKKSYPEVGSDVLMERVNDHYFKEAKEKAIQSNLSFAFETNFSSDDPTFSMREFKNKGYDTHLIFMGLNSLEESIQRVSIRVKEGGHKVSEDSIQFNYLHGYSNLYKHFHEFDRVTLLDNSIKHDQLSKLPRRILIVKDSKIQLFTNEYPEWVAKFVDVFLVPFNSH